MFQCGEEKKISQHQGPGVPEQERVLSCSGTSELHPVLTTRHQQGEF